MTENIGSGKDFDTSVMLDAVAEFCRRRHVSTATRVSLVDTFDAAVEIVNLKGPDERWRRVHARGAMADRPDDLPTRAGLVADRRMYDFLARRAARSAGGWTVPTPPWFLRYSVVSATYWSQFSDALRRARQAGLGWIVPACREVLVVRAPIMRFAEGLPGVLHDDSGREALQWTDGSGHFCLHGAEFDEPTYRRTIAGLLSLDEIAQLENTDQRSIALLYISFERLIVECRAELLDTGARGTRLYRIRLPRRIAADRPRGYGTWDYFIHMRDASHSEREFIEWVDPAIGRRRDAELCQAHAFGISLADWLAVELDG